HLPRDVLAELAASVTIVRHAPDMTAGRFRPPLLAPGDVPFAALLCFDNAFDGIAREQVEAGARLLVVLSNEAWYRGGGELEQMVAMSVFRALETGTGVVRCTVDGASCAIGPDGRILARLATPGAGPRVLAVAMRLGPGA